jgi:hypothetical protein
MPRARDYRDHPDLYQEGDFPMNYSALSEVLPPNVKLILGDVSHTATEFRAALNPEEPIGYVVLDVDYYSSSKDALKIFVDPNPWKYLPVAQVYLDDVALDQHNNACGELLAVNEFNAEQPMRKIERHTFLRTSRIFHRASWIDHVFLLHVLDHPTRSVVNVSEKKRVIANPYLSFEGNKEDLSIGGPGQTKR